MMYDILLIGLGAVLAGGVHAFVKRNKYKKLWLETSFQENNIIIKATTLRYGIFYSDLVSLKMNPLNWWKSDGGKIDKELAGSLTRLYSSTKLTENFLKREQVFVEQSQQQEEASLNKKKPNILH